MSEEIYDAHLEDLYKKYTALPEMEKRAVETLSVLFGGFYKYVKLRNLSALMGYKLTNPELTDLPSSKLDAVMDIVEELTAWWPKIPLKKKLCSCMPPSAIWPMPCWRGPTRVPACRRPTCWRCCGRCRDFARLPGAGCWALF